MTAAQSTSFSPATVLHTPLLTRWQTADGIHLALDAKAPNWIATDERGTRILTLLNGQASLAEVALQAHLYPEPGKNLQHVMSFAHSLLRAGIASYTPFAHPPYAGRAERLTGWNLRELWIHTNNSCNLNCEHCLVSSGPGGDKGLAAEVLFGAIDESVALGAERFFFTGGEPFLRRDIYDLIHHVTVTHERDLVVLTNATAFEGGSHRDALTRLNPEKVRFQVSIDGVRAEDNDPIRGKDTFRKASAGLTTLASMGFDTSLTVVPCKGNLQGLVDFPALAKRLGASSIHLMWPHHRGRGLSMFSEFPNVDELLSVTRAVRDSARTLGVRVDNQDSLTTRVNAVPGVKHDLIMAGVESLCLYSDGVLYPSAAMANHAELAIGSVSGHSLLDTWKGSSVAQELRSVSIANIPSVSGDPLRFLTGGSDLEHAYFHSGSFYGADPYAHLISELARDIMADLGRAGRESVNCRSGYDVPIVYHAMGEGALACGDEIPGAVRMVQSNCVLAFDTDRPRKLMREFYGSAAVKPQEDLCCPVRPSEQDLAHIPREVVERFYGCGSPVPEAALVEGETHIDLGSGAGLTYSSPRSTWDEQAAALASI